MPRPVPTVDADNSSTTVDLDRDVLAVPVGQANRDQVERVFFLAVRDLLPRGASFSELAAALRLSARTEYGTGAAVTQAVDQALSAVGL